MCLLPMHSGNIQQDIHNKKSDLFRFGNNQEDNYRMKIVRSMIGFAQFHMECIPFRLLNFESILLDTDHSSDYEELLGWFRQDIFHTHPDQSSSENNHRRKEDTLFDEFHSERSRNHMRDNLIVRRELDNILYYILDKKCFRKRFGNVQDRTVSMSFDWTMLNNIPMHNQYKNLFLTKADLCQEDMVNN